MNRKLLYGIGSLSAIFHFISASSCICRVGKWIHFIAANILGSEALKYQGASGRRGAKTMAVMPYTNLTKQRHRRDVSVCSCSQQFSCLDHDNPNHCQPCNLYHSAYIKQNIPSKTASRMSVFPFSASADHSVFQLVCGL